MLEYTVSSLWDNQLTTSVQAANWRSTPACLKGEFTSLDWGFFELPLWKKLITNRNLLSMQACPTSFLFSRNRVTLEVILTGLRNRQKSILGFCHLYTIPFRAGDRKLPFGLTQRQCRFAKQHSERAISSLPPLPKPSPAQMKGTCQKPIHF